MPLEHVKHSFSSFHVHSSAFIHSLFESLVFPKSLKTLLAIKWLVWVSQPLPDFTLNLQWRGEPLIKYLRSESRLDVEPAAIFRWPALTRGLNFDLSSRVCMDSSNSACLKTKLLVPLSLLSASEHSFQKCPFFLQKGKEMSWDEKFWGWSFTLLFSRVLVLRVLVT